MNNIYKSGRLDSVLPLARHANRLCPLFCQTVDFHPSGYAGLVRLDPRQETKIPRPEGPLLGDRRRPEAKPPRRGAFRRRDQGVAADRSGAAARRASGKRSPDRMGGRPGGALDLAIKHVGLRPSFCLHANRLGPLFCQTDDSSLSGCAGLSLNIHLPRQ